MSGVLFQCAVFDTRVSLLNQHLGNLEACPVIESDALGTQACPVIEIDALGTKPLNNNSNILSLVFFYGLTTCSNGLKEFLIFCNPRVSFPQKLVKLKNPNRSFVKTPHHCIQQQGMFDRATLNSSKKVDKEQRRMGLGERKEQRRMGLGERKEQRQMGLGERKEQRQMGLGERGGAERKSSSGIGAGGNSAQEAKLPGEAGNQGAVAAAAGRRQSFLAADRV